MEQEKPNVVLIMCDQMAAHVVGCYGNQPSFTPNIDRLAANGVRFDRFYCNSPMCCPSRASTFSGRYPSDVNVYDNGAAFRADIPTFVHGLKGSGYRTFLSGKAHFVGPDQHHGFDSRLTREIYPSSFIWTPDWRKPVSLNSGSNVFQLRDSGECLWSLQMEYDDEVLHHGLRCLREQAKSQAVAKDSQPFFLNISFTHPHDPFIVTGDYMRRIDHQNVQPPRPDYGDTADHPYNQWINRHHGLEEAEVTEEEKLRSRHAYYGACAYIDDCVGAITGEIARLGLSQSTVVVFASDHGEMLGEHGMWFKRTYFEEAVRVPFIMSWPGTFVSGRTVETNASLVDLFPTLCEVGSVKSSFTEVCGLRGTSLVDLAVSGNTQHQKSRVVIVEYLGEGTTEPLRAAIGDNYKLVTVRNQPSILFDLRNDPFENTNLAESPIHQQRRLELNEALMEQWNPESVRASVIASQARRYAIHRAAYAAHPPNWDRIADHTDQGSVIKRNAQMESEQNRYPPADWRT